VLLIALGRKKTPQKCNAVYYTTEIYYRIDGKKNHGRACFVSACHHPWSALPPTLTITAPYSALPATLTIRPNRPISDLIFSLRAAPYWGVYEGQSEP
jgi:hypothetical protein